MHNSKTINYLFIFKLMICTGIFLHLQPVAAVAQQQAYFNNLTEKDGLSNNRVTCFFEDKTGYMWIGTESGLNLYNGNSWKVYKPSLQKKNYLSNGFITDVEQDAKGSIWVCTRKGLNRIDMAAGTTEVFLPGDSPDDQYISSDLVWDAYPDTDTSIWLAPDSKDFCYYNPAKKRFYRYSFRDYLRNIHQETMEGYHSILRILPKSDSELWLATTDGIFSFNKQTGAFTLQVSIALSEITFFYFDKIADNIYCVDEKNKFYAFKPLTKQLTAVSLQRNKHLGKFIAPYTLNDKQLFAPAAEGLAALNEENDVQYFLAGNSGSENDLLTGRVNCIFKDRQQITWVGTMNGVSKFIPALNNNLHLSFPNNLSAHPNLVLNNFVYRQAEDSWLLASWKDNKVFIANNKTGIIKELQRPAVFSTDTCYAFYSQGPDSIFMLCRGSLLLYNYRLKEWNKIIFPSPYNKTVVTCMTIDNAGNYWLSNMLKQLFVYDPQSRKIWVPSKNDIGEDATNCLASDAQNNCIWIGTSGYGIIRYDYASKKFKILQPDNNNKTALHSYIINQIVPDGKANIWVATFEGGLAKYNTALPPDKGFTNYELSSGLPDDNVYSMALDQKGTAWFNTINGIGQISAAGKLLGFYNQQSGLPYSKFRQRITTLPDGKIATITDNNFICFNPADIKSSYDYPVTIDDIFLSDSVTVAPASTSKNATFSYALNTLTFNFSVLDFSSPAAIEYYYMLQGFEKDWVFAGKQHSVRYSNLPPGKYSFKVKAKREHGDYYQQEASFQFSITPAFWQRAWFYFIVLALAIGFVYWLIRKRINSIRHEAEMKQKIAETEMMALRAQMNPHFIFNCLNSIDNLIQMDEKEKATLYLSKFAKLIRSILENSAHNTVPCWKDMETMQLYLELEGLRFDHKFTYEVNIAPEILNGDYKVPPLIIQPYVENAIHHGLLNKLEGTKILQVTVHATANHIHYLIEDNGIGRKLAATYKQQNKLAYGSMGMQITEERITLFNQHQNGAVTIEDLCDENNEPNGTRVAVSVIIQP